METLAERTVRQERELSTRHVKIDLLKAEAEVDIPDKVCEWLKDNLASFWQCNFYNDIKFNEDFRKAMEGGEKC